MFGENGPDFGAASDGMFKDQEKCTWLFLRLYYVPMWTLTLSVFF